MAQPNPTAALEARIAALEARQLADEMDTLHLVRLVKQFEALTRELIGLQSLPLQPTEPEWLQ